MRIRSLISSITSNSFYKVGLIFGLASTWKAFVTMAVGVLMIKWISPENLGLWQSLTIIQLYIGILEVGVPNGLNRELPYRYGTNEVDYAIRLAKTAQYFMKFVGAVLFLISVCVSLFLYGLDYSPKIVLGVFAVGSMVSLLSYDRYLTVTYRSSESFLSLSKISVAESLFRIMLIPVIFYFGYFGLLIYFVSATLFQVAAKHLYRPIKDNPEFYRTGLIELIKIGLPVYILNYMRGVSSSFNKLILLKLGSVVQVGLFAPVAALGIMVSIVPSLLGNYLFPKMNIVLGQTKDNAKLWPMALKTSFLLIPIMLPGVIALWFLIPPIMNTYFLDYNSGTVAMQVFSINLLFGGMLVSHNVIYAVKKYKLGTVFGVFEFLIRLLFPLIAVYTLDYNILLKVSIGFTLGTFFLFILNIILIRKALF